MRLGLVNGAGEVRCVQHSSNDKDDDNAGSGQQDVTFFHKFSSLVVVRISRYGSDALFVNVGPVLWLWVFVALSTSRFMVINKIIRISERPPEADSSAMGAINRPLQMIGLFG